MTILGNVFYVIIRMNIFRYQYSGMPREATNYPIYDDFRESRGYHEPRYAQDRGGYRSGRGRPDYGGRGGGR